uniref:Uncharacterized protein n=1 Tax=Timema shepardi TaxID=629360 RepID=A0A7R9AXD7_TIMSH|nr:unnamed protein product [Timema shepardi]
MKGSVLAFAWRESGKIVWKLPSVHRDSNLNLLVIGIPIYCESSTLDHEPPKLFMKEFLFYKSIRQARKEGKGYDKNLVVRVFEMAGVNPSRKFVAPSFFLLLSTSSYQSPSKVTRRKQHTCVHVNDRCRVENEDSYITDRSDVSSCSIPIVTHLLRGWEVVGMELTHLCLESMKPP